MVRQQFLSEMEQKLRAFDERLDHLAARPLPRSPRAQAERERQHFHMLAGRAELRERLRHAGYTPDESWRDFKEAMQSVYDGLARRLDKAAHEEDSLGGHARTV
jgi:multidrug resistance efflux pump